MDFFQYKLIKANGKRKTRNPNNKKNDKEKQKCEFFMSTERKGYNFIRLCYKHWFLAVETTFNAYYSSLFLT